MSAVPRAFVYKLVAMSVLLFRNVSVQLFFAFFIDWIFLTLKFLDVLLLVFVGSKCCAISTVVYLRGVSRVICRLAQKERVMMTSSGRPRGPPRSPVTSSRDWM